MKRNKILHGENQRPRYAAQVRSELLGKRVEYVLRSDGEIRGGVVTGQYRRSISISGLDNPSGSIVSIGGNGALESSAAIEFKEIQELEVIGNAR